jgi:hypothetical protein
MENKQWAVEFLRKEFEGYGSPSALQIDWETFDELIAQAKAMEKEQIKNAYGQGVADEAGEILDSTKDAEEYYNKNYGEE